MTIHTKSGFEKRWYTKIMDRYRWSSVYIPYFNEVARTGLRLKSFLDKRRIERVCVGRDDEIDEWFSSKELFFGFSSIRGGTVFLTNMLKLEVPDSHIEHEANVIDYWELPRARLDEEQALDYVSGYRRNEIFARAPRGIAIYGEINPFIRRHCKAFNAVFPNARFFHMVRDPRDVIRSIMAREILSRKDPMGALIKPPPTDPYFDLWPGMSRFERICWEWQSDNRYMREHLTQRVRFEDMMNDYDAFRGSLLDYLGIQIAEERWAQYVNRPKNITKNYRFEHWSEWDKPLMDSFEKICGEEMVACGYSI